MNLCRFFFAVAASALTVFAADPGLLRMLPSDSAFVAGIRADQIRNSRFGMFLLDQLKTEEASMNQFISATGFDPRRDLTELVVASSSAQGKGKTVVVARGRFDVTKIQAFAGSTTQQTSTYRGVTLISGGNHGGSHVGSDGALAIVDANTAIAGDVDMVKAAIDRNQSGGPGVMDPKVANRIGELSTQYDAWMMSASLARLADDVRDPKLGGVMAGDFMKTMESVIGGVRFGANVELMAEATMRSEKDASALVDVVKFLAGMLQLNSQNDKKANEMARLLDKMELRANGTQFRMSLAIPEDVMEGIVKPVSAPRKVKAPVI